MLSIRDKEQRKTNQRKPEVRTNTGELYLTWLSQNLVAWGRLSSTVLAVASTGSAWEVVPDISSSALR